MGARGRFNDRSGECGFGPCPVVASWGVARCVGMGRGDRGNRRDRSGRGLRHFNVRFPAVLFFALAGGGQLMYGPRDLYRRNRCRDCFANDPVGARLSNHLHLVEVGGQGGGFVNCLVWSSNGARGRCQREVVRRAPRRLPIRRVPRTRRFFPRARRRREDADRVCDGDRSSVLSFRACGVDSVRNGTNGGRRRFRYDRLGETFLVSRVDGEGDLRDIRYSCGRRRPRVPQVLSVSRRAYCKVRGEGAGSWGRRHDHPCQGRDDKVSTRQVVRPLVNGPRGSNFRAVYWGRRRRNDCDVRVNGSAVTPQFRERDINVCQCWRVVRRPPSSAARPVCNYFLNWYFWSYRLLVVGWYLLAVVGTPSRIRVNRFHSLASAQDAFWRAFFGRGEFVGLLCYSNIFARDNYGDDRPRETSLGLVCGDAWGLIVCLVRSVPIGIRNFWDGPNGFRVGPSKAFRLNGVASTPRRHVYGAKHSATTQDGLAHHFRIAERVRCDDEAASGTYRCVVIVVLRVGVGSGANAREHDRRPAPNDNSGRDGQTRLRLSAAHQESLICRCVSAVVLRNEVRVFFCRETRPVCFVGGGRVVKFRTNRCSHRVAQFVRRQS